jgi:Mannosyl-glycoprotein endo-beta-N-acetylglucosaminidase
MRKNFHFFTIILVCFSFFTAVAETPAPSQKESKDYVLKYLSLATKECLTANIPVSITLAQGILESRSGNSELAVEANNHFGIKKHSWIGPVYMLEDDDSINGKLIKSQFRKYNSVEESFEDRSQYLLSNNRYANLFKLERTDYKGWAMGLVNAGYATNPSYGRDLIEVIEKNDLAKYDIPQFFVQIEDEYQTIPTVQYTPVAKPTSFSSTSVATQITRPAKSKTTTLSESSDADILFVLTGGDNNDAKGVKQAKAKKATKPNPQAPVNKSKVKESDVLIDIR